MKNIPTFEDFLNESIKKSDFLKLDNAGMADAIIDDSTVMSYIGRDKIASLIAQLAQSDKNKAKELVDSFDLTALNLYTLSSIAEILPEYGKKVIDAAGKSGKKEKMTKSELFDFYKSVDRSTDLKPILQYLPKSEILNTVVHCPTLIDVIDAKMCAIGAVAYKSVERAVQFLSTPDEFISIKDKQIFMDNLNKPFKQKIKDYSGGDLSNVGGNPVCASFANRFFVGTAEMRNIGKFTSTEMLNTPEGVEYFNKWFTRLKA